MLTSTRTQLEETVYRLDGPLRWALREADLLVRRVRVQPGDRVLDVGAGTGYLTLPLASAVGPRGVVHCVDQSPELLDVLRRKAARLGLAARIEALEGDATALPYADDAVDFVFSGYLLHELDDLAAAALSEMHRVVKPLGRVVVADFRRLPDPVRVREIESWYAEQPDNDSDGSPHLRFGLSDIERMLRAAGFDDIEVASWLEFHLHATGRKR